MGYSPFFTLLLLFGAYSDVECMFEPLQRVYNKVMGISNPGKSIHSLNFLTLTTFTYW